MIELSSEARRAYEVMIENLELTSQEEQENQADQLSTGTLSSPPACSETEEPEYSKWTDSIHWLSKAIYITLNTCVESAMTGISFKHFPRLISI